MLIMNLVKKLSIFISGLVTYLSAPIVAFATDINNSLNPCANTSGISKTVCALGQNPANTIRNIVVFFVMLAVVISLLFLLYGGLKWITSSGDKTKVEEARNHIISALIGLIVVILAVFLLSVVLAAFGIDFNNLKIPVITESNN